jgi:DNA/RNA endonuclease YhcR with UshA esterase domain
VHHRYINQLLLVTALIAGSIQAETVSIADARAATWDTEVTVEGYVTVPAGKFVASTFDQGFALQDDTAGIYVSLQENLPLNYHHRVRVTGTVKDDTFGQLILQTSATTDVTILKGASRITARPVATIDVGEATEGLLVEVTGTVVRGPIDDLPYGFSVFVDDGSGETQIFIPASTGVNPFKIGYIKPGAKIRVTGLSSQFENKLEVLPRNGGDIHRAK